jgi:hypothetical protein
MSSPPAPAAAATPRPLGFVSRAIGVFISPAATFEDIARKPTVIAPLVVVLGVVGLCAYFIAPIQGPEIAEMMANSPLMQHVPEAQRAEIVAKIEHPTTFDRIKGSVQAAVVIGAAIAFFSLLLWGSGHLCGGEPTYKGVVSVLAFASLISHATGFLVKLPLMIAKNTVFGVTMSPAIFIPDADWRSTSYLFLAMFFDLFAVWGALVGGIGFSKVARLSTPLGVAVVGVFYLLRCGALFGWTKFFTG